MDRPAKPLVLLLSFAGLLLGAANADALPCTSIATGNWGVAGTWTSAGNCNRVPTAADDVTIATGHTVTVNVATANVLSVTVNSGATLTQTQALSTAGALGVAGTLTSNNAMTVTGATTVTGNLNIVGAGARTFSGLVTVTGGTWNNSGNRAVTFRGGITNNGTFTAGTGTQTFNLTQAIGGASPVNFGGIVAVVGAVTVTNNNTNIVTVAGNLTGSVAGSTWVNAANSTLNYGGAAAPMGTRVFTASAVPNTVNYNGGAAQAVKTANYNNLTVTKPAGVAATTAAGTVNVTGVLTVTSGTLNIAGTTIAVTGATNVSGTLGITSTTGTKTFTGLVTVNPGGTWTNTTEAVTFRGGITHNGATFTAGTGTQTFDINSQAIGGASPINFGGIVAVTGAVTVTNNNTNIVTVAGNLTSSVAGSTWVNAANSTLNYGGAAAPMGTRVFTASAVPNTVNYNRAGAQTMKQATYHHLTVSGSGIKATGAITLQVNGTTTVAGTATLNISSTTGTKTFAGPVIVNAGSSWTNTANEAVTFRGGITHNGTTFTAGTGTQTFDINSQAIGGASPINFGGIVAVTGAVTVTNNNTNIVTIAGNLTGSVAGSTWVNAANSTLNYGGAAAPMGTRVFTASAVPNTVNYNRAGAQIVKVPSGAPATYYHLTLSGSGVKTLPATAMTIAGSFTVSGTATATAAAALAVGGNWSETGAFAPGTQTVTLNGTSAQTISGTSPVNFNNLTVTNGTNPNITLATHVTVAGALTGIVTLTSTCPIDYTLTAGALIMHSCLPVTPPANFNCVESGASASAGHLYTRLAGTGFSFDVVALKADGTVETSYASAANKNVTVELVEGSGATACASRAALTPAVSQTLTFIAADAGRKAAANMTVNKAYTNLRCRVTDANQSPSVIGCSTDNFVVRPAGFTVSSTDATNTGTSGAPAIKTGAGFNLTAASIAGYNGTPAIDNTAVTGTPNAGTIGGAFAAAPPATGTAEGNAFFYSEVGNFGLGANAVFDNTFTSVDQPNDCTADFSNTLASGKYGCYFGSGAVPFVAGSSGFGRFIPDNFNVGFNTPSFGAACGTFGYVGQVFSFTTTPVMTVVARQGTANGLTNTTTANYADAYMKLTNASLAQVPYGTTAGRYFRFDALGGGATPVLDTGGLPPASSDPAIGTFTNGVGTLTFGAGTGALFTRSLTAPNAPFNADIALALNVVDADGVAFAGNPATFGAASAGGGIAFGGGKGMRFGRLKLVNAHGSELLNLPVPVQAQFWNGTAFVTNTADNCTALAANSIALTTPPAGVGVSAGITLSAGAGSLILTKPTTPAKVSVDLCVDLGADPAGGTVCSATSAARSYLQGIWPLGANYNNDPAARATFGVYKGGNEFIYLRENY
ncbi:MAG: hypothetical protein HY846_05800 [Nitrosomonadales bacterium]|nr:hypothetical protein [Nitrosomonadales bacterium]